MRSQIEEAILYHFPDGLAKFHWEPIWTGCLQVFHRENYLPDIFRREEICPRLILSFWNEMLFGPMGMLSASSEADENATYSLYAVKRGNNLVQSSSSCLAGLYERSMSCRLGYGNEASHLPSEQSLIQGYLTGQCHQAMAEASFYD